MPTIKSAFKSLRQNKERAKKNKVVKSQILALVKKARKAILIKDKKLAEKWLKEVIKVLDKAVQRGIIKKNTAARKKSRLVKLFNSSK